MLGNESAVPPKNGSLYTEDDWNETSSIKNNEAYWLSKVLTLETESSVWIIDADPATWLGMFGLHLVACLSSFLPALHETFAFCLRSISQDSSPVVMSLVSGSLHVWTCLQPRCQAPTHISVAHALLAMRQVSAEKQAWKMSKESGFDLVTILPNFILGPALSRQETKGLSVGFMKVTHYFTACKGAVVAFPLESSGMEVLEQEEQCQIRHTLMMQRCSQCLVVLQALIRVSLCVVLALPIELSEAVQMLCLHSTYFSLQQPQWVSLK